MLIEELKKSGIDPNQINEPAFIPYDQYKKDIRQAYENGRKSVFKELEINAADTDQEAINKLKLSIVNTHFV